MTCQTSHNTPYNVSESAMPAYTIFQPLLRKDGSSTQTKEQWLGQRTEQLRMLEREMYGVTPVVDVGLRVISRDRGEAFGKTAVRWQLTIAQSIASGKPAIHLLVYLPAGAKGRVPVFLGLNYSGNQSTTTDPGVQLGTVWVADPQNRLVLHPEIAGDRQRGTAASQWPIEEMLRRGYGFATVYDGDLEPDFDGGSAYGFRSIPELSDRAQPEGERWGAIGVWAWGLSRALDALAGVPGVDAKRVIVIGHSRLGKSALWAAAQDVRFAGAISNESGKGGAALMKRNFGETVEHLNTRFPYWFDANFRAYTHNEGALPFDSSLLLALIAPRPLFIASADGDPSLDARGEFLATVAAAPVYRLLGVKSVPSDAMPPLDVPSGGGLRYYIRPGKHDMTSGDWEQYLNFADQEVK